MLLIKSDLPMQALLKRFALIYLPIVIVLSIVLLLGFRFDEQSRVERATVREEARIEVARKTVAQNFSAVESDLRIIANLPSMNMYLDSGKPAQRERVEKILLVLARETGRYDQIRYLDASGQEVIRVNYNDGKPIVVPREQLQNKSGRYYFSDSIKLDRGEIFVSPLDLNVEHDRVETPYKPMVRFGTPVFDSAGRKKGIVLLNYFGNELLENFREAMAVGMKHNSMLLNRDGYWLSSDKHEDEWGFMLNRKERTFGNDSPEAWRSISATGNGSLQTDQGLYIYTTVYPLLGENHSSNHVVSHSLSPQDEMAHASYWKIVSFVPYANLLGTAFYNQTFGRILLVIGYLLLALAAFVFARMALSRELAKREITKLNAALEKHVAELAAEEENLSVTLKSIGDGVLATDAEGRITRLNVVAEQLTGWSQTEAAGRPVDEIFHIINQETRRPAHNPVTATLALGTIHGFDNHTVLIARDGSERAIADSCAPIRNRDGAVIGAVLVFRDVTQEYAAQAALRDSTKRIETILNSVGEGIHGIDLDGKIIFENYMSTTLLGWNEHEMIGQPAHMLIHHTRADGSPYPRSECRIYAALQGKESGCVEDEVFWCKDGTSIPVSYYATPMRNDAGEIIGAIVSFSDITERKRTKLNLQRAKEAAEQANHAKDSFLATMSHEIRTPLTGMLGMLEVLSMTSLDDEQNKTLGAAWDSARGLLRIVNDILDWSKIQEGKLALSPQSTSIPQLLQEVVNTYSRVASSKSLILRLHADSRLSAAHIVDPLRLSQVLNNFVSNALKFTQRGEIELRAELIEQRESGEQIRFSVKDTGVGIPKEIQKNLFQRFHQESADTARQYGGTGLGLSICLRLAELLDGQIELISSPGQGSTFSITVILPVSAAPGEKIPTLLPVVEQKKVEPLFEVGEYAPLVLAVDDHPINRDLLARQIKLLGLRVETAEDGKVALSKWRDKQFALIITDCHMPEMDGYTFTRSVRKIETEERRHRTPIIAWTANARAEEGNLCNVAGMDDLLVKPANLNQLKEMLSKWLFSPEAARQSTPAEKDAHNGQSSEPIDFAALSAVVPDSTEHVRVLMDFQTHIQVDLAKLIGKLEKKDWGNVEREAHRMKGSCRMVGATDMASACATIEQNSREGNEDGANAGMMRLNDALNRFETYLIEISQPEVNTYGSQ